MLMMLVGAFTAQTMVMNLLMVLEGTEEPSDVPEWTFECSHVKLHVGGSPPRLAASY